MISDSGPGYPVKLLASKPDPTASGWRMAMGDEKRMANETLWPMAEAKTWWERKSEHAKLDLNGMAKTGWEWGMAKISREWQGTGENRVGMAKISWEWRGNGENRA